MGIKRVKLMRGVEAERFFATPVQGEPIMTVDELKLYLGDGNKAGGYIVNADNTIAVWPDQTDATKKLSLAWWIAHLNGAEATIRIPRGTHEVLSDMTIPENICLKFDKGASLKVADTKTLTINGAIEAGFWQIFDGLGTIAGEPRINEVYPQWFGAKADNSNDDGVAINKALTFAKTSGISVYFVAGKYKTSKTLVMDGFPQVSNTSKGGGRVYGESWNTVISYTGVSTLIDMNLTTNQGIIVENLVLVNEGVKGTTKGIIISDHISFTHLNNLKVFGFDTGIQISSYIQTLYLNTILIRQCNKGLVMDGSVIGSLPGRPFVGTVRAENLEIDICGVAADDTTGAVIIKNASALFNKCIIEGNLGRSFDIINSTIDISNSYFEESNPKTIFTVNNTKLNIQDSRIYNVINKTDTHKIINASNQSTVHIINCYTCNHSIYPTTQSITSTNSVVNVCITTGEYYGTWPNEYCCYSPVVNADVQAKGRLINTSAGVKEIRVPGNLRTLSTPITLALPSLGANFVQIVVEDREIASFSEIKNGDYIIIGTDIEVARTQTNTTYFNTLIPYQVLYKPNNYILYLDRPISTYLPPDKLPLRLAVPWSKPESLSNAPAYGYYQVGDIVRNDTTVSGTPKYWLCYRSGYAVKDMQESTAYVRGDYIKNPTTGKVYICVKDGTSGTAPLPDHTTTYLWGTAGCSYEGQAAMFDAVV